MMTPAERFDRLFPLFRNGLHLETDEVILGRAPMRWMWTGWRDVARVGGGDCSNAALQAYAFATLRRSPAPDRFHLVASDVGLDVWLREEDLRTRPPLDHPHGMLLSLLYAAGVPLGLELSCTSKGIPAATGLGTSAALQVVMVKVLAEAAGVSLDPVELIHAARLPESYVLGKSVGFQDQGAAVQGGLANYHTRFEGEAEQVEIRPLEASTAFVDTLDAGIVVVDFGKPHSSHQAHMGVFEQLDEGDKDTLQAFELLGEAESRLQAAVAAGDFDAFAHGLDLTWQAQGLLHPDMILPIMRDVVDMARGLGVRAANVNGAGMGGTVTLLAEPDAVGRVVGGLQHIDQVTVLPCGIERRGVFCWRRHFARQTGQIL